MPLVVRCPNPACMASCSVAEANGGRSVKCPKCGKPFVARPTIDGRPVDTKKGHPSSTANPFPVLPAEFGRYRIVRLLGQGGMGAVYLAEDSQLGRQVALKIPFIDAADSPNRAERFVREARSAAILHHPNICTVFDAGQLDGRPFITMAYIEGTSLEAAIDPEVPMPQRRAAEIVRKVALALEHAHGKGTVHRDLKPANVMISADGEPVVMDFGLAKRVIDVDPSEAKLTRAGGILGTPSYMSPEQVKGDTQAIGPATDIYSLGVMLFEMLTGKTPYTGSVGMVMGQILAAPVPPVREFRPDVDPRLDAICRKAMAKEPGARFSTMAEFAKALGLYLEPPAASPSPLPVPLAMPYWLPDGKASNSSPSPPHPVSRAVQVPRIPPLSYEAVPIPISNVPKPVPVPLPPARSPAALPPPPRNPKRIDRPSFADQDDASTPTLASKLMKNGRIAIGLALLVPLGCLLAVVMLRVETPNGTLIVEMNDAEVEARIKGGKLILSGPDGKVRYTLTAKERNKKLDAGPYKIRVEGADGLVLDTTEFTLVKGGQVTVRVTLERKALVKQDPPGLDPDGKSKEPRPGEPPVKEPPPKEPPPQKEPVLKEGPKPITNSIGMKLVRIPNGEFMMGSPDEDTGGYKDGYTDEKPRHKVEITKAF